MRVPRARTALRGLGGLVSLDTELPSHLCRPCGGSEGWEGLTFLIQCSLSQEHSGRVFRLQFDEFQIISSSHDDTILIWDFLNVPPSAQNETRSPSRTYTYISR